MPIQVVDLFCGVGGLTRGLLDAGLNVIAGFDVDPTCQFTYENNNLVELYLNYKDNVTETYNVEGELNTNTIKINYEITKDDSSAILEGTYKNNEYKCEIITLKKVSEEGKPTYCNNMKNKINNYIDESNNLTNNKTFNEYISIQKKEVVIK